MPEYSVSVVEDAIVLLEALLADSPQRLSQLTRTTGLSKNKAFRLLHTLEKHRLVERRNGSGYGLGVRFVEFGARAQRETSLLEACGPVLDDLCRLTEETIFLGVIDGHEALCIDMRESPHPVRLFAQVGRRAPLYAGGVPKVLLAFSPESRELLKQMELEGLTPYTITDPAELEALLERVRSDGYLVISDDLDVGAHSIAAPIRDPQGDVVAALSVAGPSSRFTPDRIDHHLTHILEAAREIGARLSRRPHDDDASISPATTTASREKEEVR
jgi:IclR family KDG regulon transcriptional repressor